MNRIRQYKGKYQVLITPTQLYNTSYELMAGGWTDEHLRNYFVNTYVTLGEAQEEAYQYPDIDWVKMILSTKSAYQDINKIISDLLEVENINVKYIKKVMSPEEAKNTMFNRVINNSERFNLSNNFNDLISFKIINPWTNNLLGIANKLTRIQKLRIFKKEQYPGMIRLVGKTDLSMTYEIILITELLNQFLEKYTTIDNKNIKILEDINKQQMLLDKSNVIL
jgi:hypothetical protein